MTTLRSAFKRADRTLLFFALVAVSFAFAPGNGAPVDQELSDSLGRKSNVQSGDLDQCANGGVDKPVQRCEGPGWVNGNLNEAKAHYFEDDSVPYRLRMTGMAPDVEHQVTIEWDTLKQGKHAVDYLTSFDRTETDALPCSGVTGCDPTDFDTEPIVPQPDVVAAGIMPHPGVFTLFGGDIVSVSPYSISTTGDAPARVTITFTASKSQPVLAWAGHIATRADWGMDSAAVNIPGSPYHMRFIDLNGKGGNQDRSLSASAVIFPASMRITKDASPDDPTDFAFTTTGTGLSDFVLDDDADGQVSNTQLFSDIVEFDTKTVTESDPGPTFQLTDLTCIESGTQNSSTDTSTRTATINLEEAETVECIFTNTNQTGTLRVIKVVENDQDGTATPADFSLHVKQDDADVAGSPAAGSTTGTVYSLIAGAYVVSEDDPGAAYSAAFTGDCDATGAVTVEPGVEKSCTITNTDNDAAPAITVDKSAPASVDEPGGNVTFSVSITNDSGSLDPVTLTSLTDDVYGDLLDATNTNVSNNTCLALSGTTIQPAGTVSCSFDGAVSGNAGSEHTDTVTAGVTDDDGSTASDDDSATVTVSDSAPAITVDKSAPASVDEPGGQVTFSVSITNDSNNQDPVTLTSLSDDVYGDLLDATNTNVSNNTCLALDGTTIQPGSTENCSFDGAVSGNAGSEHTDTVTGEVTDDDGSTTSDDDSATVTVSNAVPAITVDKSAPSSVDEPGGNVTFSVSITNDSNNQDPVTLTSLSDDVYGNLLDATNTNVSNNTCLALDGTTIQPGSTENCSFDGAVSGNAGSEHTDTVTGEVTDDDGSTASDDDSATVTVTDAAPAITVDKSAPSSIDEPGGQVTFSVSITNDSNNQDPVTLTSLSDDVYGDLLDATNTNVSNNTCLALDGTTIQPGDSASCTFDGAVSGSAGSEHTDTVTGEATDDEGNQVSDDDSATVTVTDAAPAITVEKSAPASVDEPGGQVTFSVSITNDSNNQDPVTLTSLSDDVYGDLLDANNTDVSNNTCLALSGTTIQPGDTASCSFDGAVSGNAGSEHTDTVTAEVTDDEDSTASDNDSATVTIADAAPAVTVDKSAPSSVDEPGGQVTFSVSITNDSNNQDPVTLTSLSDDVYGNLLDANNSAVANNTCLALSGTTIQPAGTVSCSFDGAVSGNAGSEHTDTVTAGVTDDDGSTASDDDSATVTIGDAAPAITVDKSAPSSIDEPGGQVTFSVSITNDSNNQDPVTLTALSDDVYGDLLDATNADVSNNTCLALDGTTIQPGDTASCSFDGAVSGSAGSEHTDTVTGRATDDEGNEASDEDSATVTVTDAAPAVSVVKDADPQTVSEPGGQVTFSVSITNDSNNQDPVTLTALSDDVYGDLLDTTNADVSNNTCLALDGTTIQPGDTASCSFDGAVSGNAGSEHTDTVTAEVTDDDGSTASGQDSASVSVTDTAPAISMTKDADPSTISEPGGPVTFAVAITNDSNAQDPLTIARLTDDVYGDLLDGTNAQVSDNTCLSLAGAVVSPGASVNCSFTGNVGPDAGQHVDTVTVGAADDEGNEVSANDSAEVTITDALPDISVVKTADPLTMSAPGGDVTFAVTIENGSVETVTVNALTDDVYGDLLDASNGNVRNNTCVTLSGASVDAGASAACSFDAGVGPAAGIYTDEVTATASDNEGNQDQASDIAAVNVLSKSSCPETAVAPGGAITYTIPYGAFGADVSNLTVVDELPAGFAFETAPGAIEAPAVGSSGTVKWVIPTVAEGQTGELIITGRAPTGVTSGTLSNTVTVSADGVEAGSFTDEVVISIEGSGHEERAIGASVRVDGNQIVGPLADTDDADPDIVAELPANPAAYAKVIESSESGDVTSDGATSQATATTAAVGVVPDGSGKWLVEASAVRANSTSDAAIDGASSSDSGSWLTDVVVNGEELGNVTSPQTIVIEGPLDTQTTTVHLLERIERGTTAGEDQRGADSFSSGLTVNAIHVTTVDGNGDTLLDVVVASASSDAQFRSGVGCNGSPVVSGSGFGLSVEAETEPDVFVDEQLGAVRLPSTGGEDESHLNPVDDVAVGSSTLAAAELIKARTTGAIDVPNDTADATTKVKTAGLRLLDTDTSADESFLISADLVDVKSISTATGDSASSTGTTTIADLVVAGVNVCETLDLGPTCRPAPNTELSLAGGDLLVILNEQIEGPTGTGSTGLTVNGVHIFVLGQNDLGLPAGAEIIVSQARTAAASAGGGLSQATAEPDQDEPAAAKAGPPLIDPADGSEDGVETPKAPRLPDAPEDGAVLELPVATPPETRKQLR